MTQLSPAPVGSCGRPSAPKASPGARSCTISSGGCPQACICVPHSKQCLFRGPATAGPESTHHTGSSKRNLGLLKHRASSACGSLHVLKRKARRPVATCPALNLSCPSPATSLVSYCNLSCLECTTLLKIQQQRVQGQRSPKHAYLPPPTCWMREKSLLKFPGSSSYKEHIWRM